MHTTKVRYLVPQALALTMALFLGLIAVGTPAQAAENYGYQSISYAGVVNTPTSDKPQSKLWWNDGSWWADMWTTGTGWQIYRLDRATKTWVSTGVTNDARSNTLSDTLWDGNKLYIASHVVTISGDSGAKASVSGQPAKLYRYSYAAGKYTLDSGFPTNINNNSSESMTIDKDTTGAVWATWTQVSGSSTSGFTSSVYVNSAAGGASWGTPFVLPVADPNPAPDDISAIVSFGSNKIGVMWSDAPAGTVYWATRTDGTPASAASSWKVQPAVQGKGQADDHLNIKALLADPSGRVYAAVKTSLDSSTDKTLPQLQLMVFRPGTGSFTRSTIATLADCVTRPQILLDTTNNVVRAFHTAPSTSVSGCAYSGVPGSIYEKTASMDNPVFGSGRGTPVIQDGASANVNDVTTTKQSVNATTGAVLLASNKATQRYWFSDRSLGTAPPPPPADTTPPTVIATSPAAGASGVAVAANVTGSFSEAMDASTVSSATFTVKTGTTTVPAAVAYNSTDKAATLNPTADLAAGTTYTATIKGGSTGVKDAAGNALATDRTWTFTTATAGGGSTSETVTLTATADSWVAGGAAATNYGTATTLSVDSSPAELAYLKFDLSTYAGRTVESATLQLRSAGSGSAGKQNVKLVADDSWTEGGITYNNRPTPGTSIGTLGPTTTNASYSIPLTASGVAGDLGQQLSLVLDTTSTDGLDLNSREAGSTAAPKLVLTLGAGGGSGGSTPPPADTTAPTVTGTSPTGGATGVATTTNVTATFSEAMNASTITPGTFTLTNGATTVSAAVTYNSTGNTATLDPGADLAAGTTYTATVKGGSSGAKDGAGNALAADRTWTFTTASAGGSTAQTVTLTATADSWVAGLAPATNYGTATTLSVDNSPAEVTYLKFDLSAYAGRTLESATLQLRSAGSGSLGKQNVKLVTDDSWTEGGITYNTRPAPGTILGTLGPTAANSSYSVLLASSGVAGELGHELSLGLDTTSTDGLDLNSREAGSTSAPKLVLTLR